MKAREHHRLSKLHPSLIDLLDRYDHEADSQGVYFPSIEGCKTLYTREMLSDLSDAFAKVEGSVAKEDRARKINYSSTRSVQAAIEAALGIPVGRGTDGAVSVTGEPYVVYCSGSVKPEGAAIPPEDKGTDEAELFSRTCQGLLRVRDEVGPDAKLYWRWGPQYEWEDSDDVELGRGYLIVRVLISAKPEDLGPLKAYEAERAALRATSTMPVTRDGPQEGDGGGVMDSTSDGRTKNNVMRHEYKVLSEDEKAAMKRVKDLGLEMIEFVDSMGQSREFSLAKTKVEEAVFWAVKGTTK